MREFLTQSFYGNSITDWALSLLIVVLAVAVGKVIYWICGGVLRRATAKTETSLDDFLLDMMEEPVVFAVTVTGIWVGTARLKLPETAAFVIDKVVVGLIVIAVTWLAARLIDAFFTNYLQPFAAKSENDLDDELLPILRSVTRTAVWSLGVIIALDNAGYDLGAVLAGLGIGGLALAMASKDTVANIFGGFTIFTDRPFRIGERIQVSGFDGVVEEVGLRSTRIRTLAGRLVTMPNAKFADAPVENVSAENGRKVTVTIGLTYDMDADKIEQAIAVLQEIVEQHEAVDPERILTAFTGFGDFSQNVFLLYWIKPGGDIMGAQTEINLSIRRRFDEAGLEMAFPTQTIYQIPVSG